MVYIIEGIDGTGKSTCVEMLKQTRIGRKAIFIKESVANSEFEKLERLELLERMADSNKVVVYDRATAIDDFVYNELLFGEKSTLDADKVREILDKCQVIYFRCDKDVLSKRLDARGDEYGVTGDALGALYRSYKDTFEMLSIKPYVIDTTNVGPAECTKLVTEIISNKSMKIAQIVPVSCQRDIFGNGYHMCLAHLVKQSDEYRAMYEGFRNYSKCYMIMDNGAAEDSQLTVADLLECYKIIHPDEMVLPDTLCNGEDTLEKTTAALLYLKDKVDCSFMAVPQGATMEEWKECARVLIQMKYIHCLGISKFLQMKTGLVDARYEAVKYIDSLRKEFGRYDIEVHLLGCTDTPKMLREIHKAFPFVRGCDSAYGYLCSKANVHIYSNTNRPAGEIDFLGGERTPNIRTTLQEFELAADVFNNKHDESWEA